MSEMTLIVPNDWVTEEKLVEITGLRPGTIERARKKMLDGRTGIPSRLTGRRAEEKQRMHV